jgi:L-ascorbate metabolism protein UlaG (beta-lactamase superfamily)
MKIKWLGHAAFLITAENGTRIITDPYQTNEGLRYGQIKESADIVTVSHEHGDHNNSDAVQGKPQVVKKSAKVKGIDIRGISAQHDDTGGSQRGTNTIFCFEVDGVKICHMGDLGHKLNEKQAAEIGKIDVLMIPVGGFFTVDAETATQVCNQLKPRVIIPMHYLTDKLSFPIKGVDEFLKGKNNVVKQASSEVEFKSEKLPASTQIIVLKSAL